MILCFGQLWSSSTHREQRAGELASLHKSRGELPHKSQRASAVTQPPGQETTWKGQTPRPAEAPGEGREEASAHGSVMPKSQAPPTEGSRARAKGRREEAFTQQMEGKQGTAKTMAWVLTTCTRPEGCVQALEKEIQHGDLPVLSKCCSCSAEEKLLWAPTRGSTEAQARVWGHSSTALLSQRSSHGAAGLAGLEELPRAIQAATSPSPAWPWLCLQPAAADTLPAAGSRSRTPQVHNETSSQHCCCCCCSIPPPQTSLPSNQPAKALSHPGDQRVSEHFWDADYHPTCPLPALQRCCSAGLVLSSLPGPPSPSAPAPGGTCAPLACTCCTSCSRR